MDGPPPSGTSRDVSWPLDGTVIDATVVMPVGQRPVAAVVMAAGSGPTDRDWNSPLLPGTNGSARLLANALAEAGIASLRFDKRASGPRGPENMRRLVGAVSMRSHRDEFAGAVHTLTEQQGVEADHIFAVTNSEGALHALNYQITSPAVSLAGLVLIGPPGRAVGSVARAQLAAGTAELSNGDELMSIYDAAIDRFLAGEAVTVDPALPEGARSLLLGLTSPLNQPFARELWTADAAQLLSIVEIPVLVVIGKKDVQVDWQVDGAELERAASSRSGVTFLYPENADHVLKYESRERSQLSGADAVHYNAAGRRLDPEALNAILAWIERHSVPGG
jgi:uncharacterized protein